MGKQSMPKSKRCGLCGESRPEHAPLMFVSGEQAYYAAYAGQLLPIIFEADEAFSKRERDSYIGCHACLSKHLCRLDSVGDSFNPSCLGDTK
jgi:hypothetical protein